MKELTRTQKLSDAVAEFCGSWKFIIMFAVFTAIWVLMNTVGSATFDHYPFILLNLVFTVIELFQGPLIMMSENRQKERMQDAVEEDREVARTMNIKLDKIMEKIGAEK